MSNQPIKLYPDWLEQPEVKAFAEHCARHNIDIRFVGGCVRDTLMQRAVHDIDVATSALPQQVMEAFEGSDYKAIATGLEHGTVTVVVEGKPFEVTTLRRDIACNGRHAEVAFTDDWAEDAQRRDFTMNALMLAPDGALYDYTQGQKDALEGRVRFIGKPQERIAEDYLRILRFFRFYATHGKVALEQEALLACQDAASHLRSLSIERITQEMLKLLSAENPIAAIAAMQEYGICKAMGALIAPDMEALERLVACEREHNVTPPPLLRFVVGAGDEALSVAQSWKLSRKQHILVKQLVIAPMLNSIHEVRLCLYRYGREVAILCALRDEVLEGKTCYQKAIVEAVPVFPVSGKDLLAQGVEAGKGMGDVLKALEEQWIASDFEMDKSQLLAVINYSSST